MMIAERRGFPAAFTAAIALSLVLAAFGQDDPPRDPGPPSAEGEGRRRDMHRRAPEAWRDDGPEATGDGEHVERMLAALKEAHPLLYRRLMHARERNPEHYRRGLAMAWRWYRRWSEMPADVRDESLKIQRLTVRIVRLTAEYRRTEEETRRRELRKKIKELAAQRFDAEQKLAELRLAEMERKLAEMRERLERREDQRDEVIERNVEAWLSGRMRDVGPDGWGGDPPERRRDRDAPGGRGDPWRRRERADRDRPLHDPSPEGERDATPPDGDR